MNYDDENYKVIELYDHNLTPVENFAEGKKYILLEVNEDDFIIKEKNEIIPSTSSKCIVSTKKLRKAEMINYLIFDYETLFGTRYNIFKRYDCKFFECDERVFFEALLIKFQRAGFKRFNWDMSKIGYELGIKRSRRDSIVRKFIRLGIITYKVVHKKKTNRNGYNQGTYFNVNSKAVIDLLPSIFSDFDFEKVRVDFKKYLKPALK